MSDVRLHLSRPGRPRVPLRLQQHPHRRVPGRNRARRRRRRRRLHRHAPRHGDLVPCRRALGRGTRAATHLHRAARHHGRRRSRLRAHRIRAAPRPRRADGDPLDRPERVGTDHDRGAVDAGVDAAGRTKPRLRPLQRGCLPCRRGGRPGRGRAERAARHRPRRCPRTSDGCCSCRSGRWCACSWPCG